MSYIERSSAGTHLPKVLVVDDEIQLQKALVNYLRNHNLNATGASCRAEALWSLSTYKPDIILLDIKLGEDDGLEILRHLRTKNILPVILMTGHLQDKSDRVVGLELGADDYLLKPFDMRELVARVRANLRRREMDRTGSEWPSGRRYDFCGWVFDQPTRSLTGPDARVINLTRSEFTLLSTFVNAPFQLFSRQQLLQATRVHDEIVDRSIDVLILRLRRKLEADPQSPRLIKTQRGVGYVFAAEVTIK